MAGEEIFFRRQAQMQREQAAGTDLVSVRERCERAASAWDAMAERAERFEKLKIGRSG